MTLIHCNEITKSGTQILNRLFEEMSYGNMNEYC